MTALFAYTFFVWVELIGFDNAKPDFGVDEYLDRMAMKPQAVSLLLDNDGLFLSPAKRRLSTRKTGGRLSPH